MVVMMDGTATEFGSQVAAALFGYLIGVSCAVASFIFGRHVFDWLRSRHPLPQSLTIDEGGEGGYEERARGGSKEGKCGLLSKLLAINLWLVIAVAGLLSAFVAGDAVEGSLFYRKMWMAAALSPFGAVLRWKLAELNSRKLKWTGVEWFPWGTFIANFSAALVSILMEALDLHVVDSGDGSLDWVMPIVQAVEVGFSGSLSTVSTMIRDIFFLQTPGQASIYCSVTILSSMLMSLMIYSPIVRSN